MTRIQSASVQSSNSHDLQTLFSLTLMKSMLSENGEGTLFRADNAAARAAPSNSVSRRRSLSTCVKQF